MAEDEAAGAKGVALWIWLAGAVAVAAIGGGAWYAGKSRTAEPPAAANADAEAGGQAPEGKKTGEKAADGSAPAEAAAPAADTQPASAEAAASPGAATTDAAQAEAATGQAATEPAPATGMAGGTAAAEPAPAQPPGFDIFRAEADGSVQIAGKAGPGRRVAILADGTEVGSAVANDKGDFAALLTIPPSSRPRTFTLSAPGDDGRAVASEEAMILAPTATATAAATADAPAAGGPAETVAATATPGAGATVAAGPAKAPEVLVADAGGVRKLAPGAATNVVIDTISYSATGDVLLAGRGIGPGANRVNLYVDNAPAGSAGVGADGTWQATLSAIEAGRYTLRADEVDPSGKVVSRFETPFQREAPDLVASAAPAAATAGTATAATGAAATAETAA
ncbi:MAG: hypothetical protein ACOY4T_09445, partial [Pseudomonadota bacterium]